MSIVAIVSQKGGSGKTTLALHLATAAIAAKKKALVIDMDPQATASAWADWRGNFLPEVVTSPPARLARTIEKARARDGIDFFVIDTPPHADAAAREAIKLADVVLVPSRPRAFDLHALEATAEMTGAADKQGHVLLNAVPAGATRLVADAEKVVADMGLATCPVRFGDRADFHRSSQSGEVAAEIDLRGKAAQEVSALWKWIDKQLKKA